MFRNNYNLLVEKRDEYHDIDFIEGKYFKQLVYETLLNANSGGVNKTSVGLVLCVCLPLAGISSVIYYQPNLDSAEPVANVINMPKNIVKVVLVTGGIASNFILNAYFSYDVPKTIINRIKAIAWPGLPKTTLANINYKPQTNLEIAASGSLGFIKLSVKAIPVLMSTAQYISLGVDAGIGDALLIAQLGAYGLMHWFAVTHFIENWGDKILDIAKKPYLLCSEQAQFEFYILACRKTLISTYKTTLQNTLYAIRKTWKNEDRDSLEVIYNNLNALLNNTEGNTGTLYELAFDLQLQLLRKAEQPNIQTAHWLKRLPFHLLNAALIKLCYISYDLAVWHYAPNYCVNIINNQDTCNNDYFIIPFRLLMIFPLSYLTTCIVAPENTNKLWSLLSQLHQKKHFSPIVLQRYPLKVYSISGTLLLLAVFSWGATVSLNQAYISDEDVLKAANVNSIIYNTYFNAFALPYVALGFSILSSRLIGKIMNLCGKRDERLLETLQDNTLENFLEGLSSNIDLLDTVNLLKQIRSLDDNEKIKIILGGKEPHDVIDNWPQGKSWTESLDFLVKPMPHPSLQTTGNVDERENDDEAHVSSAPASLEYTLSRRFFKVQPQIVEPINGYTVGGSRSCPCSIL